MFKKPPRSLFKRYDDSKHWGLFIPVGRKKILSIYDPAIDGMRLPGLYQMHFCITIKLDKFPCLRMRELRVRIGLQYLEQT